MSYSSFASVYDSLTFNVDYEKRADYITGILKQNNINDGLLLDLACGTGISVCRVCRALLVGAENVIDFILVFIKAVVYVQYLTAGITENGFTALFN